MREFLNDENSLFDRNTIIEKAMVGKFYFFKCEDCGNISSKMIRYRNKSLIYSFYCVKCNRKRTNLAKFGCENPFQSSKIKNKIKETTLKRYGVDNVNKLSSVRQKYQSIGMKKLLAKRLRKPL